MLRECRRRSGLSLRQLSIRAKTSHSALAAYEADAREPNLATFLRIVKACGFELTPLLAPADPFEDRLQRGQEIVEVLDLADHLPHRHSLTISGRFPA